MNRNAIVLSLSLLSGAALSQGAVAQGALPAITEAEAHAIGVDAYIYFYPLVTMDITRKQFTNIEPGKELGKGPMNMFVNVPAFPPADLKSVVRANFDTLYSIAWLDLTKEPHGRLGAGHQRTLLSPADARHVDGRFRIARMAHDRNAGGQLSDHAAWMERYRSCRNDAYQCADAVCLGHRPHED